MNSGRTRRPKGPENRPPETGERSTERGKVLQWRPRPAALVPDRDADADFFDFPHRAPAKTITSRIFAAERRMLDPRRARTLPWRPGPPGPFWRAE